ncbi:MAG TPA: hypothetical protein VNZ53_46725 [Steroidobacteraceae bacterium]|nr:hypothetical protein [Steroidobacteraceae bacterium]
MTLKRLFVITAAIAFGGTAGVAAVIGAWMWWAERPKPRDTAAIRSHYEKAFTETDKDNERVLELRYALRNTTKRDVDIGAIGTTLYVQRRDGSLQDVKNIIGNYKLDEAKVPAGETILYMLHPKIPYEVRKDCKVQTADDPTKEQLEEFLRSCFDWLSGFVLMSADLRIDMPFASEKPKN